MHINLIHIKPLMTKATKLHPVEGSPNVSPAKVGPVEVTLLTYGDFSQTAVLTHFRLSLSAFNPGVLNSISRLLTLPKIVIRASVVFAVTCWGAVMIRGILSSTGLYFKNLTTRFTRLNGSPSPAQKITRFGTILPRAYTSSNFSPLQPARVFFEFFFALLACKSNHLAIIT